MKKAVILIGKKQYLVSEGQELDVDHLSSDKQSKIELVPLMIIENDSPSVGQPQLEKNKVTATIVEQTKKAEKTVSIRYKAKKRVHKIRGNRRLLSRIKIDKIS